ncbi:MAG TPA: hypothetical protein VMY99_01985 [Nevskiaceae bacterium]|nr:hypothetical protein [Nevskiaceae bacterium]
MHRLLHLQHHRHTGKLLPHRYTSYRSLFLLLLIVGAGIVLVQQRVLADDLVVTGKVAAEQITSPAVITYPPDGSVLHTADVTVQGTCQPVASGTIVIVYSNNMLLGSTSCSNAGTFSLPVTLFTGPNTLIAKSVNITDDYGPDSAAVHVAVDISQAGTTGQGRATRPSSGSAGSAESETGQTGDTDNGLIIRSQRAYLVFGRTKPATWTGMVAGGIVPYQLIFDWGDGTVETLHDIGPEQHKQQHTYTALQPFFVEITATDAAGHTRKQQLVAVTPDTRAAAGPLSTAPPGGGLTQQQQLLIAIYVAYSLTLSIVALAWYDAKVLHLRFIPLHSAHGKIPYRQIRGKRP